MKINWIQQLQRQIIILIATAFIFLTALVILPTLPAHAKVTSPSSEIHLFLPNEWKSMNNKSSLEVAAEINQRLDIMRNEIGRAILHKIHSLGVYEEAEPVLFAAHDGGIYVFRFVLHWNRDLKITERKHTTVVDWEVLKNQHYRTIVQADDSTFAAKNIDELNYFFFQMLGQDI
ncbi:MAG: hypothetical protein F6K32_00730 [Desertifilum sp. SIO1I2]|nr:hypothetical protein [Desertifilum sp. SIO1I2]